MSFTRSARFPEKTRHSVKPSMFKLFWLTLLLGATGLLTPLPSHAAPVSGSISPLAIEIDANANLYPSNYPGFSNGPILNSGPTADWVKDAATNSDPASLTNSIAVGIIPGVTGASGGTGHWNGVRIVDGVDGGDKDIFLTGGKENDTRTWNVGAGTVGSSKYDITQAYLANNQQTLFFAMERRGNNGTTAFDFEFNQKAPSPTKPYLPTRTIGDVLFTFEMSGSGSSGSATPYYFVWNGTGYVARSRPASMISSINNVETPAAPWGFVNSNGSWAKGNLLRFGFAEAAVDLAQAFPGFDPCNTSAYVQVRTRSSATETSDLKDTTKVFEYVFGGPSAAVSVGANCSQQFTYSGAGSTDVDGGTDLTYLWDFKPATGVTLNGTGVTGPDANGVYHSTLMEGTVNVVLPAGVNATTISVRNTVAQSSTCTDSSAIVSVVVYRVLSATARLAPRCDNVFTYSGTASGGKSPYTYAWQFQKNSLADGSGTWSTVGTSTTATGTFTAPSAGAYRALLTVSDTADTSANGKGQCETTVTSNTINVYPPIGGTARLTPDCDDTFTYSATASGGKAPYTFTWTVQKLVSGSWVTARVFATSAALTSTGVLDVDTFAAGANGDGRYRVSVKITDSQGLGCNFTTVSNEIEVRHALTATAVKTSANGAALTVLLTATTNGADTLQWQRRDAAGNWVDISAATAATLTYSSFEADSAPTATSFAIGTSNYYGKLYQVQLRVHAERTLNGITCEVNSAPVTVRKVIAVDP